MSLPIEIESPVSPQSKKVPDAFISEKSSISNLRVTETSTTFDSDPEGGHSPSANNKQRRFSYIAKPWKPHNRKIFLASSLVVAPMVIFTLAILCIVFGNRLDQVRCLNSELCPGPDLVSVMSKEYYYIDFPATQLAFVSSWTSTVSFTLISALMTLYGYLIARRLLRSSTSTERIMDLPSPYQLSTLIRVLNADMLMLWELGTDQITRIFWRHERSSTRSKAPSLLRGGILVFLLCVLGSILIQAADTYLHITTEAINFVQAHTVESSTFDYGRGLAPWCLDRQTVGTRNNKNFWGCGMVYEPDRDYFHLANRSALSSIDREMGSIHHILNFQDDNDNTSYAIIGPSNAQQDIDWKASSYGISTQCSPVPASACNVSAGVFYEDGVELFGFNCTDVLPSGYFTGNFTSSLFSQHTLDAHKYLEVDAPFNGVGFPGWRDAIMNISATVTDAEVNDVFANPWHWVSMIGLGPKETADEIKSIPWQDDPHVMQADEQNQEGAEPNPYYFMMISCNTTVYDVTYTAINQRVTHVERKKSNGTIAGSASLPGYRTYGALVDRWNEVAVRTLFGPKSSFENFTDTFALAASGVYAIPLATQTSGRAAELVQRRVSRLVTRLPMTALWLLVVANMMYMILGIILALLAFVATNHGVYQVHTKLGIAGLVSELFESVHSRRPVVSDSDLFEEKATESGRLKHVGIKLTNGGGTAFSLH